MPKTLIIAEVGVNHNGCLKLAKELVYLAKEVGADAVKFQTFCTEELAARHAPHAAYQQKTQTQSQFDMLKTLELSQSDMIELHQHCEQHHIQFLSTPFDLKSLNFLVTNFEMPWIKIASGDITHAPLLLKIAQTKRRVILSTGMSLLREIETALSILAFGYTHNQASLPSLEQCDEVYLSEEGQQQLCEKVALLHCTTEYPAPVSEINLNVIKTLQQAFGLPVGYSDHTNGHAIAIAAVAMGATIIEKHFTLDKKMQGPDHQASLEPDEMRTMIQGIRSVELALGHSKKIPTPSETPNRLVARKSLVALKPIQKGETFNETNLGNKRPGNGISAIHFWSWIGKVAECSYEAGDLIVA